MAFVNDTSDPTGQNWRTVDYERNLVLKCLAGPDSDGTYAFELLVENRSVQFQGTSHQKASYIPEAGPVPFDIDWKFNRLFISPSISMKKEEILELIAEALIVWGSHYQQDKASSVTVTFTPKALEA